MAQILVRGLTPELKEALRREAASRGVSMEAHARAILTSALTHPRKSVVQALRDVADEHGGIELDIPPRHETQRVIALDS